MRSILLPLLVIVALLPITLNAQQKDSSVNKETQDSTLSPFVKKVWDAAAHDKNKNESSYKSGKIKIKQEAIWGELSKTAQNVKLYLVTNADVKNIEASIPSLKKSLTLIQEGIFINKGSAQTERNLSVSSVILSQLITQSEAYKKRTDKYTSDLIGFRNKMDSLLSDPVLYVFARDSVSVMRYLERLRVIAAAGDPSDNALNESLANSQRLQNELDSLLFAMHTSSEKIENFRNDVSGINLKKEFSNLWESPKRYRPFNEIIRFSFAKEKVALLFYVRENMVRIFIFCCVLIAITLGVYSLRSRAKQHAQENASDSNILLQHPLSASILVVLSIYQFAFINAPFIFSFCIWSIQITCLLIILVGYISPFWVKFWTILSGLFLLASLDNFVLQASRMERWFMAALCLAGVVFGISIIFNKHRSELKEKSIIFFIRYLVIAELFAFGLNLFGRYNLSKTFFVAGYSGTVCAIIFLWVVRLINEGLRLGSTLYHSGARRPFLLNFNRVGNKAPSVLYVLLVAGWCLIVGRHFYIFRKLAFPISNFLQQDRTVGDYSFTFNGILLFCVITICSMVLSRIVSFFADDIQSIHSGSTSTYARKPAIGSWILLIRILIISLGLFLAFAASGFPLDKVTIVLGALSVGIGLGLQGLVSNLVSGLIIAFEKPVNVGDLIEVDGKSGIMKSIGFRSSVVSLRNGSNLVVPNSDLLNNHVVNWYNSRNARKVTISLGVAYGSDLKNVKAILEKIANDDERTLDTPAPLAIPRSFGASAINIELSFWVKRMGDADMATGDIILNIDTAFRENNIQMPFPRQDVHIYTDPEKDEKKEDPSVQND